MMKLTAAALVAACAAAAAPAADFHDWAPTPPMGWNSWDCHGANVKEHQVVENAQAMVDNGMLAKGWNYIVVDIRWFTDNHDGYYIQDGTQKYTLDEYGRYLPDTGRFPSAADGNGFKSLADKIHSMGFKFGIHIMRGVPKKAVEAKLPVLGADGITCDMIYSTDWECPWLQDNWTIDMSKPGAQEYYNSIINLYASWGVDFIKVDDLSRPYHTKEIEAIRKAIDGCGRPIVLSMSPGMTPVEEAAHCQVNANMWRMMDDFWDRWSDMQQEFERAEVWNEHRIAGAYPDCDMIPFGKLDMQGHDDWGRQSKFTHDEQLSLMTLWSIFRSPLMYGGDVRFNTDWENSLLLNDDMIRVNQKSVNNRIVEKSGAITVWGADDPDGQTGYMAIFNTGDLGGWVPYNSTLWTSEAVTRLTTGFSVNADVAIPEGSTVLALVVDDAGDGYSYDHADWISPTVVLKDGTKMPLGESDMVRNDFSGAWYDHPVFNKNYNGDALTINGEHFPTGIAAHANSMILFKIPADAVRFTSLCGIDDSGRTQPNSTTSVRFMVYNFDPINDRPADDVVTEIPVDFVALGYAADDVCDIYDIWANKALGSFRNKALKLTVPVHGCAFLKIKKNSDAAIADVNADSAYGHSGAVYNLGGIKVSDSHDLSGLGKGVYIADGKKILVTP